MAAVGPERRARPANVLRGLLDAATEGLLALDEHGAIVEANAAAERILGHALPGAALAALIEPSGRRLLRTRLAQLEEDATERLEVRLRGRDEPWQLTLRAVPGVTPRIVTATLARRIESFAGRLPFAILALRPDLRVAFANEDAGLLLGDEAVRPGAVFGPGVPPALRMLAARIVNVPAPLLPTVVDAGELTFRVSGIAAGGDEPALLLLEDVSEQRRRDRVIHEFFRNAAHQLRTPLAGITAAAEMLQSGAKEQPETRDLFLGHIERHADRLTRLTRGLLTLARYRSGDRLPVDRVELAPLLERIAAAASPADGVALSTECEPGAAAIATPDLLHETIAALVDNAVAHTRTGEIRLRAVERDGTVAVAVSDTGSGIPPELRELVFEPFFRIEPDAGDGYGLGLAIAAQAVDAMGGRIAVDETPGGGTTFTMTLRSAVTRA